MIDDALARPRARPDIPRRELVTLAAYLETGSHKGAAHRLGISESTARQRVSSLIRRLEVTNVAQAVWVLRGELEADRYCVPHNLASDGAVLGSPRRTDAR